MPGRAHTEIPEILLEYLIVTSRLRRTLLPTLLVASLALAGCGKDDAKSDPDKPEQTLEDGTVISATWPLTGVEATGDQDVALKRPILVTKVDNTSSAAPQLGLGEADLVVEELVEGGTTRLAVFYYSQLPDTVGPVRSMRASDLSIVPKGAQIVTSGAAPVTIKRIKGAGYTFHGEGAKGFFRDNGRSAPYNLFTRLRETASLAETDEAQRPDDYLPWGEDGDAIKGRKATGVDADFGNHTTSWRYDGKRYVNDNSFAAKGDQFPTDTVLVMRVKVGDAGYTDPSGAPVPETTFEGKGEAMLFHGGRVVTGTWKKKGLDGAISLSMKQGDLTVPPGKVWIELVPAATGNVTVQR